MKTPRLPVCPKCGTTLPIDAPKDLCPRCLAMMNLATETVLTGVDAIAAQPPLSPAELAPQFPQLEITECLGRGRMGVVYKARQKTLNRVVALKLLAPERVADAKFAQRFTQEAQALATLNHPSIVTVYDFGQAGGFFYLLTEFVDGVNLRQAMKAERFTPEQALAIVPPVCEALQYAHEHGIVHRDIKPENLLLDRAGRVKIADFGIAKILGAESSGVGLPESQPAGTPQYMAPEQKAHHATDHRADIYSLGVVLYEMLTGELPEEKLQPPSRKVQIDVRLDEIVLRALEKAPEMRYQTAVELRTQVETLAAENGRSKPDIQTRQGEPSGATHVFPARLRIVLWAVAAALLIGLFVIFTPISWRSSRLTEAHRSVEVLEQKIKQQQQGKLDVSPANNLEDEIIRLARDRLEQTRRSYDAQIVSLIEVEEAEGELALAEARGDQLKRAEARLTIATKYLERIEKVFRTGNIGEAEYNRAKQRKLESQLEMADALRHAGKTASGRSTEDEIIRLARERLEQTRQLYQAQHISLSQVDEAEGELALAEARGDQVKRAEARLSMATKYLERIEGAHRNGNISDAEYNQAKQRKLEAELELQRTRAAASGDNQVRVRKNDDWTPTLFARAKEVAETNGRPGAKPDELIAWRSERDGMRAGLLISPNVVCARRLRTRLVVRNVSKETKALQLILTGYATALSARDARSTLRTVTPILRCAEAFFERSRLTQI